ncbi:isoprenylcysteine carboxylmethyltransferase family protein [Granulosicoccaceae sp. 1_MG-2023]|nr:isoprenylcysteine carboxylmethyltransferase family protein [Granulosicoccaceae sp. 1_MG-2023]
MQNFIARNRIVVTRWSFALVIALVLFTAPVWSPDSLMALFMKAAGFALIVLGVFGRLWSSLFICGYKTKKVIQDGPYSVTRNPLYVFSFLGAIGFALVAQSWVILALIVAIYVFIYARTIKFEEAKLEDALGVEYLNYKANTPRFFPDLSLYKSVQQYTVTVPQFQQAFKDAAWFFIGYGALRLVDMLHQSGVLPAFVHLP